MFFSYISLNNPNNDHTGCEKRANTLFKRRDSCFISGSLVDGDKFPTVSEGNTWSADGDGDVAGDEDEDDAYRRSWGGAVWPQ